MRLSGTKTSKVQQRGLGSQLYDVAGVRPTLDLDFADSKSLVDRASNKDKVTFTRLSSGTYVGSDGLIQSAAVDTARFDHDPITGESLGLLVEESRANLTYPSTLASNWAFTSSSGDETFTPNYGTAPDGSVSSLLAATGSTAKVLRNVSTSGVTPTTLTVSFFYKGDTPLGVSGPGDSTNFSAGSGVDYGNGWKRLEATLTFTGSGYLDITINANKVTELWGIQVEQGSFPTSYIPTSGSTVTRAADVAEITGSEFSSWYNQSEGTVLSRYIPMYPNTAGGQYLLEIGSDSNNRWALIVRQDLSFSGYVSVAGAAVLNISKSNAFVENTEYSSALAVSSNNGALFYDGSQQGTTDSSVSLPTSDYLTIGSRPGGAGIISAHIKRLTYFPERLPDSTLQDITEPTPAYERYSLRLDQQFAATKNLVNDVTGETLIDFTRASSGNSPGTYVDSDGLIKTSAVNLLTYSEEFDNAAWAKTNATVIPNSATAPDGSNTADTLNEDTATGLHRVTLGTSPTILNSTEYVASIYAKSASRTRLRLTENATTGAYASFDLTTATVSQTGLGGSGSIQDVGSGWYRCSMTFTSAGTNGRIDINLLDGGNNVSYAGDGTSGIYIWGAQLETGSTPTTYIPTTSVASAAPRFDHDPVTGECLGLLIEEARANLIPSSNDFGSFFTSNVSKSAGFVGPDDSQDAYKITSTTSSLRSRIFTFLNSTAGTVVTFSVYLKIDSGSLSQQASIAIGSQAIYASKNITLTTEWQRFEITGTVPSDGVESANPLVYLNPNADSGTAVAGDYLYIWGAQVEVGSFPTSYIPTSGSTVNRAADIAEITGSNFTSFYNQTEGTVFTDVASKGVTGIDAVFAIGSSGDNDRWLQQYFTLGYVWYEYEQGSPPAHPYTGGTFIKSAIGRSQGDNAVGLSGTIVQTDSYSGAYTPTFLKIGVSGDPNRTLNGHIKRLSYWTERLDNDQLIEITS